MVALKHNHARKPHPTGFFDPLDKLLKMRHPVPYTAPKSRDNRPHPLRRSQRGSPMPTPAEKRATFRKLHAQGCFVIPNPWVVGSAPYLQRLASKALAT